MPPVLSWYFDRHVWHWVPLHDPWHVHVQPLLALPLTASACDEQSVTLVHVR